MSLTTKEKLTNLETLSHIHRVDELIHLVIKELLDRAREHDLSKMSGMELEAFTEVTPKLAETTYGSDEYNENKAKIDDAIQHHYAKNRHHPEHFKNGVNDMTLIDLIEMFCDWKAASERHHDGNLRKSIEINATRFNFSVQLANIFENSVDLVE
jgi:hypothetical protein